MHGKTVVVTGATSGIGEAAALALAKRGARVVFTARNAMKGSAMVGRLRAANPAAEPAVVVADLSVVSGMKAAAAGLAAEAPSIDVLINNAGAWFDTRGETADGLERTFATNHLAYFVVTELLRPNLAAGARIVSTSSGAQAIGRLDFDDLQSKRKYGAMSAYALSKLLNIVWTRELARRLTGTGVTANCFHPGGVRTNFAAEAKGPMSFLFGLAKPLFLTPEQGADTLIWLASASEVAGQTGGYWTKRKRVEPSAAARDDAAGPRLWAESERLANLP